MGREGCDAESCRSGYTAGLHTAQWDSPCHLIRLAYVPAIDVLVEQYGAPERFLETDHVARIPTANGLVERARLHHWDKPAPHIKGITC